MIGALFIMIQFGYYPWVPKFWIPNFHGLVQWSYKFGIKNDHFNKTFCGKS